MKQAFVDFNISQNTRFHTEKPESLEDQLQKQALLGTIPKDIFSNSNFPLKSQFVQIQRLPKHRVKSKLLLIHSKLVIPLNSSFKKFWDILLEIVLAYNVITTLFFLAYSMPGSKMLSADLTCWLILLFDIPINFLTEIKTRKGATDRSFIKISKYYLKSWFFVDILSILPLSQFGYASVEYYFRMLRLFKLPGVLNITDGTGLSFLLTFLNVGKKEKNGKVVYSLKVRILASFIQILVTMMFLVYFLGCFWFWFQKTVANYRYSQGYQDEQEFQDAFYLDNMDFEHTALRSSYFILTTITTIGYGDFLPKNVYEMAFISITMLFGVTVFGYILGSFNSAITFFTDISSEDSIGKLNSWLDSIENANGKMKKRLRKQVVDHFSYYFTVDRLKTLAKPYWDIDDNDDIREITQDYVKEMPEEVYYEIIETLFSDFLTKFRIFFTESKFKLDIIPFLQPRKFEINSFVVENFEEIDEVIFVTSGIVSVGVNFNAEYIPLVRFEGGRTVIGDYVALTGKKNKFNFYAETFLHTYTIHSEVFCKILFKYYKADKINVLQIATQKEFTLRKLINSYSVRNDISYLDIDDDNLKPRKKILKKTFINKSHPVYTEENFQNNLERFGFSIKDLWKKSSKVIENLNNIENGRKGKFNDLK